MKRPKRTTRVRSVTRPRPPAEGPPKSAAPEAVAFVTESDLRTDPESERGIDVAYDRALRSRG
jgi:hypothetical protein